MTDDILDQDQLRNLAQRTAQLPRDIDPPADAWLKIEATMGSAAMQSRNPIATVFWQRPVLLAAAALLLVAGSSAITAIVLGGRNAADKASAITVAQTTTSPTNIDSSSQSGAVSEPRAIPSSNLPSGRTGSTTVAVTENPAIEPPTGAPSSLVEFTLVENEYISSANRLSAILDSDQIMLSARTIAKLRESLRVIDAAILEARRALAADPANKQLIEMLSTTYNQKIDLLKRTTEMGRS